jgi:hypothetical protein
MGIFEVLEDIRKRPTMYVGESNSERGKQLCNLDLLLQGYALAIEHHRIVEDIADFPKAFGSYLHERFGWSVSAGPVAAIRDATMTDDEAWTRFWQLVTEFQSSRQPA